jgi:hypothetical protein
MRALLCVWRQSEVTRFERGDGRPILGDNQRNMGTRTSILPLLTCLAILPVQSTAPVAARADEAPPAFKAAGLLTPEQLGGPHHTVAAEVRTEGYYHEFSITSDYGVFEAAGRSMLSVRLQEIKALSTLEDVSKTEVFLKSAGTSVVNVGKGVANAVTDPAATAKGVGSGVKRFGVNLGRRSKRIVEGAVTEDPAGEDAKESENAASSATKSLLGVSRAARRWAQKLGVDPYTTNPVMKAALDSIGEIDAAGSIATKVIVPIPGVVGMTATVGDLVWGKDPEELRKINEQRLKEIGVPAESAQRFFRNRWNSLSFQTRIIAALYAVKVPGIADYIESAIGSKSEREALFFVESAELLQQRHARAPFTAVLTDSRALVAVGADKRAILLLPVDWVRWTTAAETTLDEIGGRARTELHATTLGVALTGKASPTAAKELAARKWTLVGL